LVLPWVGSRKYLNPATADTGQDGLIEEGNGPFDVMIVDSLMPRCHGPTFIRRVRERRPGQRVLVISSRVDRDPRAGVPSDIPVLDKPFSLEVLVSAVRAQGTASQTVVRLIGHDT
jgi:DNA-binding response OmpR family regulator